MSKEWDVKQHGTGPFSFDETPKAVPADTPMEIKDFPMSRNEFEKRLAADTPTPRTDLLDSKLPWNADPALAHASLSAHARQIERELAAANANLNAAMQQHNQDMQTIGQIVSERDAALVDGERYRWLRNVNYEEWMNLSAIHPTQLDAAIDAARRTE